MIKEIINKINLKSTRITAHIDQCDNNAIRGWAFSNKKKFNEPLSIIVMVDESIAITTKADLYREDLASFGYGNGKLGFEIITKDLLTDGNIHKVSILAKDQLGNEFSIGQYQIQSNISFSPNDSIKGLIENIDDNSISGWVYVENKPNLKPMVNILIDGNFVIRCCADLYREDIKQNKNCGFKIEIPEYYNDGVKHTVSASLSENPNFQFNPISFKTCAKIQVVDIEPTIENDKLKGHLGTPLQDKIRGWVQINNRNNFIPYVELFIDDVSIGVMQASLPRYDVKQKVGGAEKCGFEFPIPLMFKDGKEHKVIAVVRGSSNFSFNEQSYVFKGKQTKTNTKLRKNPNYKGNIEGVTAGTSIRGWACISNTKGKEGSIVSIYANNKFVGKFVAKLYRRDLEENNINKGYAAFEYSMPMKYIDGIEREYQVRDESGEYLITSKRLTLEILRDYTDFDGYLKWSFFNREVTVPFREEDKRCFAYMDWLEKFDSNRFKLKFDSIEKQPLVSIIMPTYNRAYIIGNAISSVIEQRYCNWELIIVDDGSSDNTREVVDSFDDIRIKFYSTPKNSGVSKARNMALEKSSGKYISYLDTDNDWSPNFLLNMIGNMEENPEFESAYSAQNIFKEQRKLTGIRFGLFNRTLLENRNYIDMNAYVHKRTLLDRLGGFDIKLRRLVDYDLVLRYTEDNKPLAVKNALSNYYYNEGEETITVTENYNNAKKSLNESRYNRNGFYELIYDDIDFNSDSGNKSSIISHGVKTSNVSNQVKKATVIIVSYNIPKIFKKCVDSVLEHTDSSLTDIVIVDNNSDLDTINILNEYENENNITVIYNKDNKGFTGAVNQGIKISDPTSNIVLLNNDAIATSGWLVEMEKVALRNPNAGIIAPQQVLFESTKTINTHVPYADKNIETDVTVSYHHKNLVLDDFSNPKPEFKVNFIPFFCVYINREIINLVGLLDDKLGRHYRSDRLYCYSTIYNANRDIYFTPKSKLYHLHQQSTNHLKNNNESGYEIMFVKNTWEDMKFKPVWDKA